MGSQDPTVKDGSCLASTAHSAAAGPQADASMSGTNDLAVSRTCIADLSGFGAWAQLQGEIGLFSRRPTNPCSCCSKVGSIVEVCHSSLTMALTLQPGCKLHTSCNRGLLQAFHRCSLSQTARRPQNLVVQGERNTAQNLHADISRYCLKSNELYVVGDLQLLAGPASSLVKRQTTDMW